MNKSDLLTAIRCCRKDDCEHCPMQMEICDQLFIDMESYPVELVDMVIDELETK